MGRMPGKNNDNNETTQYHQGLQFQEFDHHHHHHQNQTPLAEPIDDDAPPNVDDDDLYAAPPEYQKTKPQPQAFPPPPPPDDEQDYFQSFPPQHNDFHSVPQAFPPVPDESTQQFPPPESMSASEINVNHQFFSAQPDFGVGGVPAAVNIGMSPAPLIPQTIPNPEWKTSLFDCMENPQNAIITLLFPCVTFGEIAEILDNGRTSCATSGMLYVLIACCIAMPCLMSCGYRGRLRARYGLMESPAPDCIVHCFCGYCALCQEYRELQERGIDPSIGYYGNVAKQQKLQQQQLLAMGMAPPMQQRMM